MSNPIERPPSNTTVTSTPSATVSNAELLVRLDALEAESNARRAELRRIAAELPAAISRRSMLRALVGDLRRAPDKGQISRRAAAKVGRWPRVAWRRLRGARPAA